MSRTHPSLPGDRPPADLPHPVSTNSFWHSQPSALLTAHRTTRDLPSYADAVVIGSGITGTSAAWNLLYPTYGVTDGEKSTRRPLNVVMLEAREACWGATGRNGGHCQPLLLKHPHDPSISKFELENFSTLEFLISVLKIDCEFVSQRGVRAIYDSRHLADVELALHAMKDSDPDLAQHMRIVTSKSELKDLRVPNALGALVTDIAARMWPYKFVSHILEHLLNAPDLSGSFNLQTLTPATSITKHPRNKGKWLISTPRGDITASKVILATNAYTSHLLPSFAPLIVPVRGQMSALTPLSSVDGDEGRLKTSFGFMGEGIDDYLIQRPTAKGGHLMFGGGRQFGLSVGITDDSVVDDDTAKYLRTRLVEALGLPEGQTGFKSQDTVIREKASRSPETTVVGPPGYCCDSKFCNLDQCNTIEELTRRMEFLENTFQACSQQAIHEFQMQLCFLGLQNQERLMMARQDKDKRNAARQKQGCDEAYLDSFDFDEFLRCPLTSHQRPSNRFKEKLKHLRQNPNRATSTKAEIYLSSGKPVLERIGGQGDEMMPGHESPQDAKLYCRRRDLRLGDSPANATVNSSGEALATLDHERRELELTLFKQATEKILATLKNVYLQTVLKVQKSAETLTPSEKTVEQSGTDVHANDIRNLEMQDHEMQLMFLELENEKRSRMGRGESLPADEILHRAAVDGWLSENIRRINARTEMVDVTEVVPVRSNNCPPPEYETQLKALEKLNEKRLLMAAQEQEQQQMNIDAPPINRGSHALQDHHMQLMLLEQQNKKRVLMATQGQDNMNTNTVQKKNYAKQDYKLQLHLLEQQNHKRLLMARQEQDNMITNAVKKKNYAKQDYELQLHLLEQQNHKRLLMARQEQDLLNAPPHNVDHSPQPPTKRKADASLPARPKPQNPASTTKASPQEPVQFNATHEWTGIMAFSRDDLPWVGPVPEHDGIYISAGYTGHGMPNAWLCGAAVSVMVKHVFDQEHARDVQEEKVCEILGLPRLGNVSVSAQDQFKVANEAVQLPEAYFISEERVERAMQMDDVGVRDWAEMERARRKREGRPLSGYA